MLSFRPEGISFKAPRDWDDDSWTPFRQAMADLAKSLGAKLVGDEGEDYDLDK